MASSPPQKVLSNEVKDESKEYESDCWSIRIGDDGYFTIAMMSIPNEASDFLKWKALIKKVATVSKVYLRGGSYASIDKQSFCTLCIPLFCDAIKSNTIITSLKVSSFALNNNAMKHVCDVLQTHTTITYAWFHCRFFSDSIGADLEKLIVLNNTLKTLAVDITAEEAAFVGRSLPRNSSLTVLDLEGGDHHMGNKGLRMLCEGLKANNSITNINLQGNKISDKGGAEDLFSLLEVNHCIVHINLRNNRFISLPEGFAFLTHVKTLNLLDNCLRSPPQHVATNQAKLFQFFADYRYGPMKLHFLLGFHARVGHHSSIRSYLYGSSIFEPNLLKCIFWFLP